MYTFNTSHRYEVYSVSTAVQGRHEQPNEHIIAGNTREMKALHLGGKGDRRLTATLIIIDTQALPLKRAVRLPWELNGRSSRIRSE